MTSGPTRSWLRATAGRRSRLRLIAILGVLLLVAALAGHTLTRPGRHRAAVGTTPEVRTFCPGSGQGPCAQLGVLGAVLDARAGRPDGPAAQPLSALQLNLCNSGQAACYPQLNKGRAVGEAFSAITALRPQIVTLNEICRDDVAATLYPAMVENFPDDHVFWAFQPAGDPADSSQPYRCRNGDEYGIGILGRIGAGNWHGVSVFNGLYPEQGGLPDELRAWLCVAAVDNYYACTTHLTYVSPTVALGQCRRLLQVEVPAMRAVVGSVAPVVVAGDLNLVPGGTPDVLTCVPAGYQQTGDGGVQQLMASGDLHVGQTRAYEMRHTDHHGWFVSFNP
ncbi:endonuclease/exonuclease/phosphatase family protein [Micromonospora sp. NPDC050417]|uniref:endonuclease/exonuclease/phosphatase family protein n=1 Tax=Micromonospora sp. NPDC050417 TaxID=3364280 RepID=UPI0037ADCFC7